MLDNEDLKASRKFLISVLFIFLIAWCINYVTGIFTALHLDNEKTIALQHGANSTQFQTLLNELIEDADSTLSWEREIAAIELGKLVGSATVATPTLRSLLNDDVSDVRKAAGIALKNIESSNTIGPRQH